MPPRSPAQTAWTGPGYVRNLVPVTLGNIVGGSGLVALVYHVIYRRGAPPSGYTAKAHKPST